MRNQKPINIPSEGLPWGKWLRLSAWVLGITAASAATILITLYFIKKDESGTGPSAEGPTPPGPTPPGPTPPGPTPPGPTPPGPTPPGPTPPGPTPPGPTPPGPTPPGPTPPGPTPPGPTPPGPTPPGPTPPGPAPKVQPPNFATTNGITGVRAYFTFLSRGEVSFEEDLLPASDGELGVLLKSFRTHYRDSLLGKAKARGVLKHANCYAGKHLNEVQGNRNNGKGVNLQFSSSGIPREPTGYHFQTDDWLFQYSGSGKPMKIHKAGPGICLFEPDKSAFGPFHLFALAPLPDATNAPLQMKLNDLFTDEFAKKISLNPVMTRDLDVLLHKDNLLADGLVFKRVLLPFPPDPWVMDGESVDFSYYENFIRGALSPRDESMAALELFARHVGVERLRAQLELDKVALAMVQAKAVNEDRKFRRLAAKAGTFHEKIIAAIDLGDLQRNLALAQLLDRQLPGNEIEKVFRMRQATRLEVQQAQGKTQRTKNLVLDGENFLKKTLADFRIKGGFLEKRAVSDYQNAVKGGDKNGMRILLERYQYLLRQVEQRALDLGTLNHWNDFKKHHEYTLCLKAGNGQTFPLIYFKR